MSSVVILENKRLKCILDAHGIIHSLINKVTGASLIQDGEGASGWKMVSSLGRWREHPLFDTDNEGIIESDGTSAKIFFNGIVGKKAVSYTHLDVYKRQELCSTRSN